MTIKHHRPAYEQETQPVQAAGQRMSTNVDTPPPHPAEEVEPPWEPDYESIMERRAEKNRPGWA